MKRQGSRRVSKERKCTLSGPILLTSSTALVFQYPLRVINSANSRRFGTIAKCADGFWLTDSPDMEYDVSDGIFHPTNAVLLREGQS